MTLVAKNIDPAAVDRLAETYTELHEGLPPSRFRMEPIPRKPRTVNFLGRIVEIWYSKKVPSGVDDFHHPFAPHAAPKCGVDEHGKLHIYAGRYHTTTHGIEDLSRGRQRREHIPGMPRETVELGRLYRMDVEWFEGGERHQKSHEFSGSSRPMLAHDEHGNLHVLRGSYQIEGLTMARRHRGRRGHHSLHANPGSKRHGKKRRHVRGNPTATMTVTKREPVTSMFMTSVIVGLGGVATIAVGDMLLNRTTLTPYWKGGAEIAGGLVLGGISHAMHAHGIVTAFLTLAPVIVGGVDIYREWQANRVTGPVGSTATPNPTPAPGATGTTTPGAQAYLPQGGLPQGYYGVSQGACAVGYR